MLVVSVRFVVGKPAAVPALVRLRTVVLTSTSFFETVFFISW